MDTISEPRELFPEMLRPVRMQSEGGERPRDGFTVYDLLLKARIIFLRYPINDGVANDVIGLLLYLEQEDREKEIKIYINSPGGYVDAGLAIYDTMQLIQPPIATYCIGLAASFATILLAAGAKGKRFALLNSTIHMHQPMGGTSGQSVDVEIYARQIVQKRQRLYKILSQHTGQSIEKITRDCDRDFYLTAEEAIEYGIIDKILTKADRSRR